jgi:hypothetical protein
MRSGKCYAALLRQGGVVRTVNVALADPGKVYVIYLPHGGRVTADLSDTSRPLTGRWLNPRDGKLSDPLPAAPRRTVEFTAADNNDWALHLILAN